MQRLGIDGVVVMALEGDEITYLQGFGTNAQGEPIDPQAHYNIGRTTDTLISTLSLLRVEQAAFTSSTPIINFVPDFQLAGSNATENVTFSRLLSHSAGLGASDLPPLSGVPLDWLPERTLTNFPGARFSYCPLCYNAAATLLETLDGQPLEAQLYRDILYPLRMENTYIQDGYLYSQPAELAHFISIHLQRGRWRDVQLIKPESVQSMHRHFIETRRNLTEAAGLGWFFTPKVGLVGLAEPADDYLISAYDFPDYRVQITLLPGYGRGVLLLTDQPTQGLDSLMLLALEAFADWSPAEPELPRGVGVLTGNFASRDLPLGGDIELSLDPNQEEGLLVTYNGETAPATFIERRVAVFEIGGRPATLFFEQAGRAETAVLSIDGATSVFIRWR